LKFSGREFKRKNNNCSAYNLNGNIILTESKVGKLALPEID
jgi:hypothetical protein